MQGSGFGNIFRVSTWGESHGKALGVVIDGCPAGLSLSKEQIQTYLDRRKPGQSKYTTARKEEDSVEILSGIFEGKTTGTPISMLVYNNDHRSADYSNIKGAYRPGHADYTYDVKYGFRDYRGGGRSSARETLARVCAGAVAMLILKEMGITFTSYVKSIGGIEAKTFDYDEINNNPLRMPDADAAKKAQEMLDKCMSELDSVGSVVECCVNNTPAGLGEPVFNRLDATIAHGVMSVNAVKAVEIGCGVKAGEMNGSISNDRFHITDGKVTKATNYSGGILGGISDGDKIVVRASIKPTPSIAREMETVISGDNGTIEIKGRHDPVIGPRAVVVVESMVAIAVLDGLLSNMTTRLDSIIDFYKDK